jgi:hypothetical protein
LPGPDFPKISKIRLGIYPQMTGKSAVKALKSATNVPKEAKALIVKWLEDRYGVKLKK